MARVIDTRYVWRTDCPDTILRERVWREGTWEEYVGKDSPACLYFGVQGEDERVAALRLPLSQNTYLKLGVERTYYQVC